MENKYSLDWMDEGNCIDNPIAADMLTNENYGIRNQARQWFCHGCLVKTVCLGYALNQDDYSMYIMGGLDGNQRKNLPISRKNLAIAAFKQFKK